MRLSYFAAAILSIALTTLPASADSSDTATLARDRYEAGSQAMDAKRFGEAALFFEAAAAAQPNAAPLLSAALAWEQASFPDRACDDYVRSLALSLPADQVATVQAKVKSLESVLGRVDVTAPAEGWFAQIDGNDEQRVPASLHAMPGIHVLSYRTPNRPVERRALVFEFGQTQALELKAAPAETPTTAAANAPKQTVAVAPAAPETSSGVHIRRTVGLVTMGFGVATLVSGVVIGLQALDARDAYNAAPTQPSFDHASSLQSWTNIGLIGGGIFLLGGAALVFWPFHGSGDAKAPPPPAQDPPRDDASARRRTPRPPTLAIVPTLGGALVTGTF